MVVVTISELRADQFRRHSMAERATSELAGVQILEAGQIQSALAGPDIGDVGDTDLVRTRGFKLLIQVFRHP